MRRGDDGEHEVDHRSDDEDVAHRPDPGPLAEGYPSSSTATPTMIAQVPTPSPRRRERPW